MIAGEKNQVILLHGTKWCEIQILVSTNEVLLEHTHAHVFM